MCPACIIAIGGGLLLAKRFGVSNFLFIGFFTIILSLLTDKLLRRINHGKILFPYQRVIISIVFLFITIVIAKFLL